MNQDMINKINRIPIFDIMNVKGYIQVINNRECIYVYATDIARGSGLVFQDNKDYIHKKITATSCSNFTETIRWQTVEKYFNEAIEDLKDFNPFLLQFIQPFDRNSYILLEVALLILNRVNSKQGKRFRGLLMTYIVPFIRQAAIDYYLKEVQQLQDNVKDLRYVIDTNRDTINYNIAVLQDIAEFGSIRELKDTIMNMTY